MTALPYEPAGIVFAQLEDAIIARLKAYAGLGEGKLGYSLDIGSYGGEFDSDEDLAATRAKFPAVRVILRRIGAGEDIGHGQLVPVTFTAFVAARNLRNERATRRGAAGTIGSYQIAWDVRALLKGQTFDLVSNGFIPGAITSVLNTKVKAQSVSVYACDFTARWFEDLTPMAEDEPGEFTLFDGAWDVAPFGNVAPPLPAEGDVQTTFNPRSQQ